MSDDSVVEERSTGSVSGEDSKLILDLALFLPYFVFLFGIVSEETTRIALYDTLDVLRLTSLIIWLSTAVGSSSSSRTSIGSGGAMVMIQLGCSTSAVGAFCFSEPVVESLWPRTEIEQKYVCPMIDLYGRCWKWIRIQENDVNRNNAGRVEVL